MKCECKVVEGELKNRSRTNNDWTTEINCIWEGGGVSESFNTCTGEIWRLYRHSHHSDRLGVAIGREASFLVFTESDKMTKRRHDKIRNRSSLRQALYIGYQNRYVGYSFSSAANAEARSTGIPRTWLLFVFTRRIQGFDEPSYPSLATVPGTVSPRFTSLVPVLTTHDVISAPIYVKPNF